MGSDPQFGDVRNEARALVFGTWISNNAMRRLVRRESTVEKPLCVGVPCVETKRWTGSLPCVGRKAVDVCSSVAVVDGDA
ncbi:hypothetical protein M407DRAFT_181743 [Tulasnella calospora MUT 4182]|uniref:Uncharacterized protein n=1 Tax=Tulasnella calospora MUT 4182 TaxID=1051891 RepID=A0A0C3QCE2_9AGAM|nr:hypothetical protein M407DRAFT_181743 [Tulasnella calospora MUT 4182]